MIIYHTAQFEKNLDLYTEALRRVSSLNYAEVSLTSHASSRREERTINLSKISASKVNRAEVWEIKTEDNQIVSIGIRVSYNKKKTASLIIGYKFQKPQIVTAWLDSRF